MTWPKSSIQSVLDLTNDAEFVNYANSGITYADQCTTGQLDNQENVDQFSVDQFSIDEFSDHEFFGQSSANSGVSSGYRDQATSSPQISDIDSDFISTIDPQSPFQSNSAKSWQPSEQPFQLPDIEDDFDFADLNLDSNSSTPSGSRQGNPFSQDSSPFTNPFSPDAETTELDVANPFQVNDQPLTTYQSVTHISSGDDPMNHQAEEIADTPFSLDEFDDSIFPNIEAFDSPSAYPNASASSGSFGLPAEDATLFMGGENLDNRESEENFYEQNNDEHTFISGSNSFDLDRLDDPKFPSSGNSFRNHDSSERSSVGFLDEFDEFDDLGSLPDFDLSDNSVDFTSPSIGSSGMPPQRILL
ncbi:MAG: hypothetical protein HC772_17950 [Leptolyngbyaceae cyanobacterium CRU_2_3]|nr:hypothetical protein [Leptolyngbyaceae cyanobacterium CRU_2_3]